MTSYISMDQFKEAYSRDCGLSYSPEKKEYGQNIAECLSLVTERNRIEVKKNTTVIESLNRFKKIIKRLE